MVSGVAVVLTAGERVSQCPEATRMALGRGNCRPRADSMSAAFPRSKANIGEPCEIKTGGMCVVMVQA